MRKGILLCLLLFIASCQIISRPIQTTYTPIGAFESFLISWKPRQYVCATCLLEITFPETIHLTTTPLTYSLTDESGVSYLQNSPSLAPTSSVYYFNTNQILKANIWYQIRIYPTKAPALAYGLIGIQVVSGASSSFVSYISNKAFQYYHLEPVSLPPENLVLSTISSASTQASQMFPFWLNFNSNVGYTDQVMISFFFSNQAYSSLTISTPLLQNDNFNFIGSCSLICNMASCINPLSCTIENNQLQLILPYLAAATTYTVQFTVLNPNFVDTTGIAAEVQSSNARISAIGILNNLFTVNPIAISAAGVNLHWGIPLSVVQGSMELGLFVDGGWNTVDIGFMVSQITMIGTQLIVEVYVGALSVLEQSINTNLPSLAGTSSMRCNYVLPYIKCSPVDAFTSITLRYYITFKAYFASTDNFSPLGSVRITILKSSNVLFTQLTQNLGISTIPWSDYHDYSGFHSNSFKIRETQVIGVADSGLTNATSTFMNNFYTSNSSFVGIDPEIGNQQLVFLLKTLPSQISLGIAVQKYEMRVYANPKIFASLGTQGLDVAAFDQNSNSYRGDSVSCYINSSTSPTIQIYQCQAYKDYVYGTQIDNTYTSNAYYGMYSFICGSGNAVVCPSGQSCAQSCRIFKGKNSLSGHSGVFSIRNVKFIPGYQSSHLADQKALDFIIAFYHGGNFVSASLINAYTIKQARLSSLWLSFYNTYLSSVTTNDGARIPNLLSLNGNLSISEINSIHYDQFALFLPQQSSIKKYIQPSGRVGCSHSCTSHNNQNSMVVCQDNWICKQRISIKGIINLDSSINFKIPVQITSTIQGSFDLALLSAGTIIKIYRLHGSAISEPISPTSIPIISVATYSNPSASNSYWIRTISDTYKQGLNLNSLIQFTPSTTIDMLGSTLTYAGTPSLTFTSAYINIFSSYTSALANNIPCDQPFSYTYNSFYSVNVLWCPLINGGVNQVVINYPFFSGQLGAGFPFQTVFAYGFSDGQGNLIAFRTESNTKTSKDVCTTAHTNSFNYGDVIQQSVSLTLSIQPITISSGKYSTMHLVVSIPIQVPVSFVQCTVTQILINQNIACSIISVVSNVGTIQLSSPDPVTIMSLKISLWLLVSGVVTVFPLSTYYYTVDVQLPQTDSLGNAVTYGTAYSPFSSIITSCSFTFNLISSAATNQPIIINNISATAISLSYLADLSFNIKFSIARPNIISSSQISIQFANAITTSITTCSVWNPQNYIFLQEIIGASGVRLKPLALDTPISSPIYLITCKNIILQQNTISLSAQWIDGANILQKSTITPFTLTLPTSTSITGILVSKNYNTLGYESQYKLSLDLATNTNDRVDIWLDAATNQIHDMVLECYYLSNGLSLQAFCASDWQGKIHIILTAVLATKIDFSIYGIRQGSLAATSYRVLVGINSLLYYTSTIIDNILPNVVSAQPIIIKDQSIDTSYCISILFAFPVAYGGSFYLQLDDTFIKPVPAFVTCSIGGSAQTCSRVAPNLLFLASTLSLLANTDYLLSVCKVIPTKLDILDNQQMHFKLFTMSGSIINMGSFEISLSPYYIWSLPVFPLSSLIWSQTNFNTSWLYHKIYIGYYKTPIFLSQFNTSVYNSDFLLQSTSFNSYSYTNVTNNVLMGTSVCILDLAASGFSGGSMIDYLMVTHPSTFYQQPPPLPLFISSDKCVIVPEYSLYETYPGGITLPIILDFSNCRPAVTHNLAYTINSAGLAVDSSLTNFKVNYTYPQVYILVRQMPTNMLLSGSFTLQIELTGPYSSSFIVSPTVNLRVNAGSILQIPQSLPPVVEYQNSSFVNFTLRCNQPSTIYWALGFYPTIMAITYEVIQGRLVNGQEGLRSRVYDPYSWSKEIYGIDYQYYSNKNKTLLIDNLVGNSNYIFKYFCVNHLGFPSGGQIINFTTENTNYGLNKVELKLNKLLTIGQANLLACYIAQLVRTPYSTVTTSTFSNCLNTSFVYYPTATTTYFDYQVGSLYSYYFYIDSYTVITPDILSILPQNLSIYKKYIQNIPPYSFISISPLINAYDPTVISSSFSVTPSVVSCTVNVGVVSSYLILAYMSKVFDPLTMTIPPQYMIKQGNFSAISQFNQVYMKYGNNNITINITGLKEYQNYSIFYFVTVDNPALNSKPTKVYYYNIQTPAYIMYDLFSSHMEILMWLVLVMVSLVL